uniref:Uncharacterized protein n=1 Tax=Candidozyma auris TaxID=498019 RepID=A0A0L0NY59_CANAR
MEVEEAHLKRARRRWPFADLFLGRSRDCTIREDEPALFMEQKSLSVEQGT